LDIDPSHSSKRYSMSVVVQTIQKRKSLGALLAPVLKLPDPDTQIMKWARQLILPAVEQV
jgi:hypothetical protein